MSAQSAAIIDRATALQLAQNQLDSWQYDTEEDSLILLADKTEETPYAWVIYYTSKRWYETRKLRYALVGAGPFIVAKYTGRVTQYSSAYGTEEALKKYEEEEQLYGLRVTADLNSTRARLLLKRLLSLPNQQVLQLARHPETCVARGSQQHMAQLHLKLLTQGLTAEVVPCFAS